MIFVIGGGITGRLVAREIERHQINGVTVFDWGPPPQVSRRRFLTRAYGANYLWQPLAGFECRSFQVVTHVDGREATEESITRYKLKVGKLDDGGDWGLQFTPSTTGYELLEIPEGPIEYGVRVTEINPYAQTLRTSRGNLYAYDYLVSTIPIYSLIEVFTEPVFVQDLSELAPHGFNSRAIYVKVIARPPDAPFSEDVMYVNYLSAPEVQPYRFCDRGRDRHFESLTTMGTIPSKKLFPGKLVPPFPDWKEIRDRLATFRIFTFGRYATWNPDELVHETHAKIVSWVDWLRRK